MLKFDKKVKFLDVEKLKFLKKKMKKLKVEVVEKEVVGIGLCVEVVIKVVVVKIMKKEKLVLFLVLVSFFDFLVIVGVEFVVGVVGVKYKGCIDVMLVKLVVGMLIVGVFIKFLICVVSILDCQVKFVGKQEIGQGVVIIVNLGNVNVFIGVNGQVVVDKVMGGVVFVLLILCDWVFFLLIGVIGELLFVDCIIVIIGDLLCGMDVVGVVDVVQVIMMIDIFFKGVVVSFVGEGGEICIVGIVKGLGMIVFDMVMMLVYIFIDVVIVLEML